MLQYVGARYVPKFFENPNGSAEWISGVPYEPLTIVTYLGNSYTSKIPVPAGINVTNTQYWAATGNYNAQLQNVVTKSNTALLYFDTVNDLKDSTILEYGNYVTVGENGGVYMVNNTATDTSIPLEKGLYANLTYLTFVYPEQFGAKGDGTTDDTAAFIKALATGLPIVMMYNKTYVISSSLTLSSGQVLKGYGVSSKSTGYEVSTIKFTGTGYCLILNQSCHLANFRIEATQGSGITTNIGDNTPQENNSVIESVTVVLTGRTGTAFQIGTSNAKGGNCLLYNCTAQNGNYNFQIFAPDNFLYSCEGDGANYGISVYNYQNMFEQCLMFNSFYACCHVNGARQITFNQCAFDNVQTSRNPSIILIENDAKSIIFNSCRIYGNGVLVKTLTSPTQIYFHNCFWETTADTPVYTNLFSLVSLITITNPCSLSLTPAKLASGSTNIKCVLEKYSLSSYTGNATTFADSRTEEMGVYQIGADTTAPDGSGYGLLEVLDTGLNYKVRKYFPASASAPTKAYWQIWNGTAWSAWRQTQ